MAVGDGGYQEDRIWDTQEPKEMTYYETVCKTLKTVTVDPPEFVRLLRVIVRVERS